MRFVPSAERGGGGICFSHAVIRVMLIPSFSSNLAHIQCFISSTAAIKDASQPPSLQPNKRIYPDLGSLFSPSPFPNCIWIFISFKFDANDTKQEHPTAPGKSKTDKLL